MTSISRSGLCCRDSSCQKALPALVLLRRLEYSLRQLRPRLDSTLAKHLVEVILNRARADEHLCGDLGVGAPLRDEFRYARFLRRQTTCGVRGPLTGALAG